MRPLRLRLKGLRSYRGELEIDFSDAGLFAVIGDTGAGKSSILEAMTYALYSATTWDQRSVGALIADGATTMSVSLDFSVEGQIYRVTRAKSRTTYPPATHKLESLSDPDYLPRDGESAVTAEIERLVGLRYDAFISAVVLPQGRFDTLLRASPADRTAILKSIFRLHELAAMREEARSVADRVGEVVSQFQVQRAQLLDDPLGERERASAALVAAEAESARLGRLRERLDSVATRRRELIERAGKSDRDVASITAAMKVAETSQYQALVERDAALGLQIDVAATADEEAARAEIEAADAVTEAVGRGEGVAQLSVHATTLEALARDLPLLSADTTALGSEAKRLEADDAALSSSEIRLETLLTAAATADSELATADAAASAAESELQTATALLEKYRAQQEEVAQAVSTHDGRSAEFESATKELAGFEAAEAEARDAANRAREQVEEVRRERAAAHAAAGVGPGDPCPICTRRLPRDFSPPVAHDLTDAQQAAEQAAKVEREAAARAQGARTTVAARREALRLAEESREAARVRLDVLHVAATASIKEFEPSSADIALLAPLREAVSGATEMRASAKATAELARGNANKLSGEVSVARDALTKRREALDERRRRHVEREKAVADRVATLPRELQPGAKRGHDFATLADAIKQRVAAAQALVNSRDRTRDEHDRTRVELQQLQQQRHDTVDTQRGRLRTAHAVLRAGLLKIVDAADLPELPDEQVDLAVESMWAVSVQKATKESVRELSQAADAARVEADECARSAQQLVTDAGLADESALSDAIKTVAGDERVAKEALARSEREIPLAADLDTRLTEGSAFLAALRELAALLTDGTFIGHVVALRQRALLAVSSEILAAVSGGQYGFADDFQIVDRQTGQARSSRTLSGGETFQASLSLALGLVELAGRSGGRLDALFLDEGFGALDANALQEALAELERRATGGRLVGVVSHIRTVAEAIEQVLLVTRGPAGSHARWISRAEREAEVEREIGERLLA